MKLTQIQTIHLPDYANFELVRLETDEGLAGYGETTYGRGYRWDPDDRLTGTLEDFDACMNRTGELTRSAS